MKMKHFSFLALAMLTAGAVQAQESTVTGAAGGAVTGALVGGPVGAAIGGVVGAVAGTAIDPPPPRVVTYVREAPMPTDTVVVKEKIIVGEALPSAIVIHQVPDEPKYSYAIVNNQRVIIEPSTRRVVQVVN